MTYQVLARKWRPKSFQEMAGQSHVLKALTNALDQDRLHHAYLFAGTRGVGKTTLARILAKCLNCDTGVSSTPCGICNACVAIDEGRFVDLIEVDAASRAKVEETRDLMDNVQYAPSIGRYKVYLIDEIHMFSNHSFNALLKTLEEPPPHVKFLLATTEPKKLPITILSRCLQFNLSHLTNHQITKQVEMILGHEKIDFDFESVEHIARGATGSMRDALSLLDQAIAYCGGILEESQVRAMMGTVNSSDLNGLIQALIDADPESLLSTIESIALQNPDFDALLAELLSLLQKIAIIQILPANSSNPIKDNSILVEFANVMNKEDTQLYYQIGMMGRKDIHFAPDVKSGFEMVMIRMLVFKPNIENEPKFQKSNTKTPTEVLVKNSVTPIATQKAKENKTSIKKITSNNEWKKIIEKMELTGLEKELAENCVLKAHVDNRIALALSPTQEHLLLNQNQRDRFEQAIQTHFGQNVKLVILLEDSTNETPSETNARVKREKQKAAENSLKNDPTVKSLMDTFDASIDQDSIQPQ